MKTHKKAKFRKRYWLLVGLAVLIVIPVLFLHRPGRYNPPKLTYDEQVSPYLTHELLPRLYNGVQLGEPFELVVVQRGINDIIARSRWPKDFGGVKFSVPMVFFVPGRIVLMAMADVRGVESVVTAVLKPTLDGQGLLNLQVSKVKVGAMNVTVLARVVAKKMYARKLAATDVNTEDWRARIAALLLNDESFEPVFEIDNRKLRVEKITIIREKLAIHLVPVCD